MLGVPFAALNIGIHGAPGDAHGWVEFGYYLTFFLAGYVVMSSDRLVEAIRRDVWLAVAVGAIGFVALGVTGFPDFIDRYGDEAPYSPAAAFYFSALYLQSWAWTMAALGLGMRLRPFAAPRTDHDRGVGDAVLPPAPAGDPRGRVFVVIPWELGTAVELPIVVVTSFAITAALALGATRVPGLASAFGVQTQLIPPISQRAPPATLERAPQTFVHP